MTTYAKKVNGEFVQPYPYGMSHLKADNPTKSFPRFCLENEEFRNEYDIVQVENRTMPYKQGWIAMLQFPIEEGGKWIQTWDLVPKTKETLLAGDIFFPEVDEALLKDEHGTVVKTAVSGETLWRNDRWEADWVLEDLPYDKKREQAYGFVTEQIEHITENGLESWQEKVAIIKARYPKS